MAVPPIPYLVTTRIIAGLIAVIPLFAIALMSCWLATRVVVTVGYGQASGTYEHYFETFLVPTDLFLAAIKVLLMAMVIVSVCCFHGFRASGGPAGVGQAVGRPPPPSCERRVRPPSAPRGTDRGRARRPATTRSTPGRRAASPPWVGPRC